VEALDAEIGPLQTRDVLGQINKVFPVTNMIFSKWIDGCDANARVPHSRGAVLRPISGSDYFEKILANPEILREPERPRERRYFPLLGESRRG